MYDLFEAAISKAILRLAERVSNTALDAASKKTRTVHHELIAQPQKTELSLNSHQKNIEPWCSSLIHAGMHKSLPLEEVFITLHANKDPRKNRMGIIAEKHRLKDVLKQESHTLITGDMGSGKTTSLKKLAIEFWSKSNDRDLIFVRLRDLKDGDTLLNTLKRTLDLEMNQGTLGGSDSSEFRMKDFDTVQTGALAAFCDEVLSYIILDGIDECRIEQRKEVLKQMQDLARSMEKCRIICTSRPQEVNISLNEFLHYEIEPLEIVEIEDFAEKWFKASDSSATSDEFLSLVNSRPYSDLLTRPLMLTNLCLIYAKYLTLPEQPIALYRKFINLCLEEWDAQRGFSRETRYSQLDASRRLDFLSSFAYHLKKRKGETVAFNRSEAEKTYVDIHAKFDLPLLEYVAVVRDMESTTGLINQVQYDEFEFSHKSLSEFLVGEYLVRAGASAKQDPVIDTSPNEAAIAVALSTEPNDWLVEVFLDIHRSKLRKRPREWVAAFVNRLVLEAPSFSPGADLAVVTIWMGKLLSENSQYISLIHKFCSSRKVKNSLASYFSSEKLLISESGDISIKCDIDRFGLPNYIDFHASEFQSTFGRYLI